jgi:dihydropteroate synthase
MIFRARKFEFTFPRPTLVMGIVNVTPDSFYDAGRFLDPAAAVEHGLDLVSQGAEIIDIGGESTRPGADPVAPAEEMRRVLPVIEGLASQVKVPVSIDTQKPVVARAALRAGASIVNDIAANRADGEMWRIVAESQAGYICVHMQGTPQTMQLSPVYQDVVREVRDFFGERLERLKGAGVDAVQVVLDPGIGFGKTLDHNLQLLARLERLTSLNRPVLVGVSRKSFIGKVLGVEVHERLAAALACACLAVQSGASMIRTHDVADTLRTVRMTEAILARTE